MRRAPAYARCANADGHDPSPLPYSDFDWRRHVSFSSTLNELTGRWACAVVRCEADERHAAAVIARHAPHVLRRLAEIAAVFDAPGLHSGQGAILACRSNATGYRAVEYDSPGLAVAFDVVAGAAHLSWRAGGTTGDCRIERETTEAEIDDCLLDAVSTYINWRLAHVPIAGAA